MIIKVNSTPEYRITLKLNVDLSEKKIEIIAELYGLKNGKKRTEYFNGNELERAIAQYEVWERIMMEEKE